MSDESTIQGLRQFGYTALQFGFHSPRGAPFGSVPPKTVSSVRRYLKCKHATSFLGRLIENGHCRKAPLAGKISVYHLHSKAIYRAIGHPELRFRRPHGLDYIKTKLLSLDFVLQNTREHIPHY